MGIFSVPPDLPVTKSKEEIDKTYRYWRLHLMITSYIGYAVFYFTRKSFNFVMPAMLTDLGLQKPISVSWVLRFISPTVYPSSYQVSLVTVLTLVTLWGLVLMMTGIVNILFGMSSSVFMFITLWMINAFSKVGVGLHVQKSWILGTHVMNVVYGGLFGIPST